MFFYEIKYAYQLCKNVCNRNLTVLIKNGGSKMQILSNIINYQKS